MTYLFSKKMLDTLLPKELSNEILFKYKGLQHPTAILITDLVEQCSNYVRLDSGGWEEFYTFLTTYNHANRFNKYENNTLEYYIYGLEKW